jgi:hypothetical protein
MVRLCRTHSVGRGSLFSGLLFLLSNVCVCVRVEINQRSALPMMLVIPECTHRARLAGPRRVNATPSCSAPPPSSASASPFFSLAPFCDPKIWACRYVGPKQKFFCFTIGRLGQQIKIPVPQPCSHSFHDWYASSESHRLPEGEAFLPFHNKCAYRHEATCSPALSMRSQ